MKGVLSAAALSAISGVHGFRTKSSKACGLTGGTSTQIVNGENAAECVWKWQVGLVSAPGRTPFCGGMLVSDEWVLTAAHCMGGSTFYVVAGEYDLTKSSGYEKTIKAVESYPHYMYNSNTLDMDYAMVKLETPMEMGECIGTVCLPDDDVVAGESCMITGWGTLRAGGSQPDILQQASVDIISLEDCSGKFGYTASQLSENMICAQGKLANGSISDACQGDSGGPLVCQRGGSWTIMGATSWGRGCAGANYPGIWARVANVMPWIQDLMAGKGQPTTTPPPVVYCPEWSAYTYPDRDGDCKCPGSKKCSTDGGSSVNCPTSSGLGAWGGRYFLPDCEDCLCYAGIR